jgi:hypothetical protein
MYFVLALGALTVAAVHTASADPDESFRIIDQDLQDL